MSNHCSNEESPPSRDSARQLVTESRIGLEMKDHKEKCMQTLTDFPNTLIAFLPQHCKRHLDLFLGRRPGSPPRSLTLPRRFHSEVLGIGRLVQRVTAQDAKFRGPRREQMLAVQTLSRHGNCAPNLSILLSLHSLTRRHRC